MSLRREGYTGSTKSNHAVKRSGLEWVMILKSSKKRICPTSNISVGY